MTLMKHIFWIFLISLLVVGCSESAPTISTMNSTEVMSEVKISTNTPLLTRTVLPFLTSTSTKLITPLPPNLTPIPTLPIEEQKTYLLKLIETNGDCKLPCFLGIEPGVAIWEDLRRVEGPIYFSEKYGPNESGIERLPFSFNSENILNLEIDFIGPTDFIERIDVEARIYQTNDPYGHAPAFAQIMQQYYLENILLRYGLPSRIFLNAQGQVEPDSGTQATILLFYDNLGIALEYFFWNVVTQDQQTFTLNVCPEYRQIEVLHIYLQAPDNTTPIDTMIGNDYYLYSWLQPIDKITSLSVENFYNLYTNANAIPCFDVP